MPGDGSKGARAADALVLLAAVAVVIASLAAAGEFDAPPPAVAPAPAAPPPAEPAEPATVPLRVTLRAPDGGAAPAARCLLLVEGRALPAEVDGRACAWDAVPPGAHAVRAWAVDAAGEARPWGEGVVTAPGAAEVRRTAPWVVALRAEAGWAILEVENPGPAPVEVRARCGAEIGEPEPVPAGGRVEAACARDGAGGAWELRVRDGPWEVVVDTGVLPDG